MPPYGHIASIEISSKSEEKSLDFAQTIINKLVKLNDIQIIGPIKPLIYKLNYKYRYKILIISKHPLITYIKDFISKIKKPSNIGLIIDLNPYDFS